MSIVILAIVALIEGALYLAHRSQRDAAQRTAQRLRVRQSAQARMVANTASGPYGKFPNGWDTAAEWTERASDERRAVIGQRAGIGAVWNSDPKVTR